MDLPLCHRAVTYGSVTYATVGSTSNRAVAALRAFPGLAGLLLAVAGRRRGRERAEEPGGRLGHVASRQRGADDAVAVQHVVPAPAGQRVAPAPADDHVAVPAARAAVVAVITVDRVHARAAADEVVAPHSVQHVVAPQPDDDV